MLRRTSAWGRKRLFVTLRCANRRETMLLMIPSRVEQRAWSITLYLVYCWHHSIEHCIGEEEARGLVSLVCSEAILHGESLLVLIEPHKTDRTNNYRQVAVELHEVCVYSSSTHGHLDPQPSDPVRLGYIYVDLSDSRLWTKQSQPKFLRCKNVVRGGGHGSIFISLQS